MQEEPLDPPIFSPVRSAYAQEVEIPQIELEQPVQEQIAVESSTLSPQCACVVYLRVVKGVAIRGDAYTIKPNLQTPFMGAVVLIDYGKTSHAAYVEGVLPNGKLYISESNFKRCRITNRVIDPDDPRIRGYYYVNPN